MTEAEINCVDKMLTKFIRKTAYGVRSDFYKKSVKSISYEDVSEVIYESSDSRITLPLTECGFCACCPASVICESISALSEKQQIVITRIFFEKYTEDEVAAMIGMTQQNVHYLKGQALKKLAVLITKLNKRSRK